MAKTNDVKVKVKLQLDRGIADHPDVTADELREAAVENAAAALQYRTAQRVANEAVQAMQAAKARSVAAAKRFAALQRKVLAG
jgi:hypothetical protein